MDFVTGAFATWLVEEVADAGRSKLVALLLGTEQQRALRSAAAAAIHLTAERCGSPDSARIEQLAMVIDQVFAARVPKVEKQYTLLEALHAGITVELAPLDDAGLTGTGVSSAQLLGVRAGELAEDLADHLVQEIISRGAQGGALSPLANQLDHDVTHLGGRRVEAKVERLARAVEAWIEEHPAQRVGLAGRTRMHSRNGLVRRVGECSETDAIALGVHSAIHPAETLLSQETLPAYVMRDVEVPAQSGHDMPGRLAAAFVAGGLVVIEGASASGKTRTAFEIMRRLAPDRWLVVPDSLASLQELKNDGARLSNAIVWLDDIDEYIAVGGLDGSVLDTFCPPGCADVMLLATLRSEARNRLEEAKGFDKAATSSARAAREVFARAQIVFLDRSLTSAELSRADSLRAVDPRIQAALDQDAGAGFAEYLAAAPALLQRWQSARRGQNLYAAAIISAAVDARLVGVRAPLAASMLEGLYGCYLSPRDANRPDRPSFTEALRWAIEPVRGASSCLVAEEDNSYRAFDYLVDHVQDSSRREMRRAFKEANALEDFSLGVYLVAAPVAAIPLGAWSLLLPLLQSADLEMLGVAATSVSFLNAVAEPIYWQLSALGTDVLYVEDGATPDDWLRRAAEAGHSVAMHNLAIRRYRDGDLRGAEQWYRRAADEGHTDAMNNLGVLHHLAGDLLGAEQWYRRAADEGHTDAMNNLAVVLSEGGRLGEAKDWWQRAAALGDSAAALNLNLLQDTKSLGTLTTWYRHGPERWNDTYKAVIYRGHVNVTDPELAESLWMDTANAGDVWAMVKLGVVYNNAGDVGQARRWLQRAAAGGNTDAMRYLGFIAHDQQDDAGAARWWQDAAHAGDFSSMINLAGLLRQAGDEASARQWWLRAGSFGHISALVNLYVSYRDAGIEAEAARWFRRLAGAGDTNAMFHLGTQQLKAGRAKEGRAWLWRAANANHMEAMLNLAISLYNAGDNEEAALWATKILKDRRIDSEPEEKLAILGNLLSALGLQEEADVVFQGAAARDRKD